MMKLPGINKPPTIVEVDVDEITLWADKTPIQPGEAIVIIKTDPRLPPTEIRIDLHKGHGVIQYGNGEMKLVTDGSDQVIEEEA